MRSKQIFHILLCLTSIRYRLRAQKGFSKVQPNVVTGMQVLICSLKVTSITYVQLNRMILPRDSEGTIHKRHFVLGDENVHQSDPRL
jgi:hypothetical protein